MIEVKARASRCDGIIGRGYKLFPNQGVAMEVIPGEEEVAMNFRELWFGKVGTG
jgi:hypothetical protein